MWTRSDVLPPLHATSLDVSIVAVYLLLSSVPLAPPDARVPTELGRHRPQLSCGRRARPENARSCLHSIAAMSSGGEGGGGKPGGFSLSLGGAAARRPPAARPKGVGDDEKRGNRWPDARGGRGLWRRRRAAHRPTGLRRSAVPFSLPSKRTRTSGWARAGVRDGKGGQGRQGLENSDGDECRRCTVTTGCCPPPNFHSCLPLAPALNPQGWPQVPAHLHARRLRQNRGACRVGGVQCRQVRPAVEARLKDRSRAVRGGAAIGQASAVGWWVHAPDSPSPPPTPTHPHPPPPHTHHHHHTHTLLPPPTHAHTTPTHPTHPPAVGPSAGRGHRQV